MDKYQIAVIVGSLRRESFNRKLASAMAKLAPPDFSFSQLEIGDLPLYNQDNDANPAVCVKRLKSEISASQGLLFVTPEYNRSISGVLKNAIDHASRPYGQSAWAGKPAGVIGASVVLSARRWRNNICAIFWPTSMCPRSANPKHLYTRKRGCLMRLVTSVKATKNSCKAGWIDTWPE